MFIAGCPVRQRGWILDRWAAHVLIAAERASMGPVTFAFVQPLGDLSTASAPQLDGSTVLLDSEIEPDVDGEHQWDHPRYEHMTNLRNRLLKIVRAHEPEWFWSVDSDVLVHPDALVSALSLTDRFDAVGSKCYMSEIERDFPSFGMWQPSAGGIRRYDADGQFAVDIIMAIKLMSPGAYGVDYVFHHQGEDTGWSLACRDAGLKLGWDGALTSRHVYRPELLDAIDPRCTPIEVSA